MEFKIINPETWVSEHSPTKLFWKKTAEVTARKAIPGEVIVTIMKNGHIETNNTAKLNQIVVKNPNGEEYIIDEQKFTEKYTRKSNKVTNGYKTYIPISDPIRPYFLKKR
ncbi:MAG: RyR domain protein [Caudoviricetes sp.]|nr:MAG: RyR domain protein [Caudoviricetes sp.]